MAPGKPDFFMKIGWSQWVGEMLKNRMEKKTFKPLPKPIPGDTVKHSDRDYKVMENGEWRRKK